MRHCTLRIINTSQLALWLILALLWAWPCLGRAAEIHDAAAEGDLEKVEKLTVANADVVNLRDSDGKTALHYAAAKGQIDVVKFLLAHHADPEVRSRSGLTPFALAKGFGQTNVMAYLTQNGAAGPAPGVSGRATRPSATIIRQPGGKILRLSVPVAPTTKPATSTAGTVPLIEAVKTNDLERVKALLGTAPEQVRASDEKGWTALHWAAAQGSADAVRELLSHGAEIDAKAKGDFTPLHEAARKGTPTVVKLLLDRQADINAVTRTGVTPLIFAAMGQTNAEIVKLLLNHKADVKIVDKLGGNALLAAAGNGNAEAVRALLEAGSDLSARSKLGGGTVLHDAVRACPVETVELLLARKPDLTVRDGNGDTVLDLALKYERKDVAALLRKEGATVAPPAPMDETDRSLAEFFKSRDTKLRHGNPEQKRQAFLSILPLKADVEQVFLQRADVAWKLAEADRAAATTQFEQALKQANADEGDILKIKVMPVFDPLLPGFVQRGWMASNIPIRSLMIDRPGSSAGYGDFYFVNSHWVQMPSAASVYLSR